MSAKLKSSMSDRVVSQQLRFVVEAMDSRFADTVTDSYQIRQVDQAGNTILSLIVPAATLEPAVLGHAELFISLSPSGEVTISGDRATSDKLNSAKINIEELIKQSIVPQMLEDEPDASSMLHILKKRLMASLVVVEKSISKLEQV